MHQDDSSKITAGYVDDFTATSNIINWKNGGMLCELGQKLGYYPEGDKYQSLSTFNYDNFYI